MLRKNYWILMLGRITGGSFFAPGGRSLGATLSDSSETAVLLPLFCKLEQQGLEDAFDASPHHPGVIALCTTMCQDLPGICLCLVRLSKFLLQDGHMNHVNLRALAVISP